MTKPSITRQTVCDYLTISAAGLIYAITFNWCFAPNDMAFGGFTGLGQIMHAFLPGVSVGAVLLICNVPLFLLGMRRFGVKLLLSSLYAMVFSSLVIDGIAALFTFQPMEPILACLYGGALLGLSTGLMLKVGATTGGTELFARLLKLKFRAVSIGKLCLVIDFAVIALHAAVFSRWDTALYAVLAIFISSKVMDYVIYGANAAKAVYIMTEQYEAISRMLLDMDCGLTLLHGVGGYTGKNSQVIFTVCRRHEIIAIKQAVMEADERAFIVVCEAFEVLGEGFGEFSPDGL